MKAILISIKPKYVTKILNGEKTKEVRKRFPKGYRGWVYIYCTKSKETLVKFDEDIIFKSYVKHIITDSQKMLSGKVVARFYCDNVEYYEDLAFWSEEHENETCITPSDFFDYMCHIRSHRSCHLIHISQLEIFDKPKELSEFKPFNNGMPQYRFTKNGCEYRTLTKAPQSYCYVESEN